MQTNGKAGKGQEVMGHCILMKGEGQQGSGEVGEGVAKGQEGRNVRCQLAQLQCHNDFSPAVEL